MRHRRFHRVFGQAWFGALGLGLAGLIGLGSVCIAQETAAPEVQTPAEGQELGQTYIFKPAFEAGREMVYDHSASIVSKTLFNEDEFPSSSRADHRMRVRVESVDEEGNADVVMTYDWISLASSSPFGGSYAYDSRPNPPAYDDAEIDRTIRDLRARTSPEVVEALEKVADMTIRAKVSPTGEVMEITGFEEAVAAMEPVRELGGRMGEFNGEALSEILQSFWTIGEPAQERRVGEKWSRTDSTEYPMLGTIIVESTYDFQELNDERAKIEYLIDMSLEFKVPEDEEEAMWAPKSAEMTSESNPGYLIWDVERRELLERQTELTFMLVEVQNTLFGETEEVTKTTSQTVRSTLKRVGTEEEPAPVPEAAAPADESEPTPDEPASSDEPSEPAGEPASDGDGR